MIFPSATHRRKLKAVGLATATLLAATGVPDARAQQLERQWTLQPEALEAEQRFGRSVAVSGDLVAVGAPGDASNGPKSGAVYLFEHRGGEWARTKWVPPDAEAEGRFGWRVEIDDGRVAVAAPWASNPVEGRSGKIYLYERRGDAWQHRLLRIADPEVDGQVGRGLAMDDGRIAVGAPFDTNANGEKAGAVVVFEETSEGWTSRTLVPVDGASDGWFGLTVAADDTRIGAGGYSTRQASGAEAGAASVFERSAEGEWTEMPLEPRVQPDRRDHFGRGLAIDGHRVFVGAEEADNANGTNAGGVFELRLDLPEQPPRLIIPADGAPSSYLGFVVTTTKQYLAASEDTEVRLFDLDASGSSEGERVSELLGRPLAGGVLALAGDGNRLVVGMPFADTPASNTGAVTVVDFAPPPGPAALQR